MKKFGLIISFLLVFILFLIVDSGQAIFYNRSSILHVKEELGVRSYVDRGLIVDTYYCYKSSGDVNVSAQFKFNRYSCPLADELEMIRDEISSIVSNSNYDNFASCYVQDNNVVVELISNTAKEQAYFLNNIYSSTYIIFTEGGPYTTLN